MARIPRLGEAMGIVALSLGFILALALMSHTPGEPSFFAHGASGPARNLVGRTGATLSEALLQVFGLGAYVLVLAVGWLGGRRIFGKPGPTMLAALVGACGLLLGLLPLLHLVMGERLPGGGLDAGGLLGAVIGEALRSPLNGVGAFLFSLTVLLVCAVISTQVSFPELIKIGSSASRAAMLKGRTAFVRFRERRRKEKLAQQVIRKQAQRSAAPVTGVPALRGGSGLDGAGKIAASAAREPASAT